MSIATINSATYTLLLTDAISRRIRAGIPRTEAIRTANEMMRGCFITFDDESQADLQGDKTNERSADWTR